ncbi:MAG: DUF2959 family protein [Algisphaera sp.]
MIRSNLKRNVILGLLVLAPLAGLAGCGVTDKAYYSLWEKFGYEKRDLLVSQVTDAREQQEETREQFSSALEEFRATFNSKEGKLSKAYDALKSNYDDCQAEADALKEEITKVKDISTDLFTEWDSEIETQTNASYKKSMATQKTATVKSYNAMVSKMDEAAATMEPVLQAFNERVLLLKSSMNAQALASLQENADELVGDIEGLISEMNKSIKEADAFIAEMGGE